MRYAVLLFALLVCVAATLAAPRIPQPLEYHRMADERPFAGVPNGLNVLSNVPFAIVGALGLAMVFSARARSMFQDPWERWPYAALFGGMGLTAIGSSYYHLAPDNARLFWDRLPMTVGFTGLLTAVITERISIRAGRRLLVPLLLAGAGSVAYWIVSEQRGAGDLRFYGLVQYGSLLVVMLLLVLFRGRYPNTKYLFAAIGAYAAAKVFELADYEIFAAGNIVSGHTLKHLAAAAGAAIVISMLQTRTRSSAFPAARNVIDAAAPR